MDKYGDTPNNDLNDPWPVFDVVALHCAHCYEQFVAMVQPSVVAVECPDCGRLVYIDEEEQDGMD